MDVPDTEYSGATRVPHHHFFPHQQAFGETNQQQCLILGHISAFPLLLVWVVGKQVPFLLS